MSVEPQSFATLFRTFRLKSGISTLTELADKLAEEEGIVYENSLYTKWQQSKRIPHDRKTILKLIHFFHTHNAITTIDEANQLLTSTGLSPLTTDEMGDMDKAMHSDSIELTRSEPLISLASRVICILAQSALVRIVTIGAIALLAYHVWIQANNLHNTIYAYVYNWLYGLIALLGAISGIRYYRSTTTKDVFADLVLFLGLGMVCQWYGVQVWFYHNLRGINAPFPSIADLGYVGIIPIYTFASIRLVLVKTYKQAYQKIIMIGFYVLVVLACYSFYMRIDSNRWNQIVQSFFDLVYPAGEALPVSLALYAIVFLQKSQSSHIRLATLVFFFTIIMQFLTDYAFIRSIASGDYVNAGGVDLLYMCAYLVATYAILTIPIIRSFSLAPGGKNM